MQKSVSSSLGDSLRNRDSFSRIDERDDALFYSRDRLVPHLDSLALDTIVDLIDKLIVEENPKILDLMASWDSHIPARLQDCRVIGLGMNETELKKNRALSDYVVQDINRDCRLPFPDRSFDVVLNTVSVDYLTNPVEASVSVTLHPESLCSLPHPG